MPKQFTGRCHPDKQKVAIRQNGLATAALLIAAIAIVGCRDSQPVDPGQQEPHEMVTPGIATERRVPMAMAMAFQDVADACGIEFVNRNGEGAGHFTILESLGAGVGIIDVDRDGRDDMLLPGGGEMTDDVTPVGLPCGLFRNRRNWQFEEVTSVAGVAVAKQYSHGIACGDFDNDGFPDALVTGYGGLQLFHNLGDGTFQEVSQTLGLTDDQWSSSAAWGDLTGDGLLDLYVCHYVNWRPDNNPFCQGPGEQTRDVCPPRDFDGLADILYAGTPDGRFRDASVDAQVLPDGKGLGVVVADLDDDLDLDIYVTNDTVPNILYRNNGDGTLTDCSLVSGASLSAQGVPQGSMGIQLFDFNQNGIFDIWVTNYERETSALYEGIGNLLFRHAGHRTNVTDLGAMFVGWGTVCFDADHDGDEDVFVANGHVIRYPTAAPLRQVPLLLENQDGLRFTNVAPAAGRYTSTAHMARGCATSDFDDDGDLDMAVMHTNEPMAVLQNAGSDSGFLSVELTGRQGSRDAIGTVVEVVTKNRRMFRQWSGGGSYASTNSRRLHFGLPGGETIEELNVRWPSGTIQSFRDVVSEGHVAIVEAQDLIITLRK